MARKSPGRDTNPDKFSLSLRYDAGFQVTPHKSSPLCYKPGPRNKVKLPCSTPGLPMALSMGIRQQGGRNLSGQQFVVQTARGG